MIFISAGHHFNPAGADPGAIANGYKESELTRELRDMVVETLSNLGANYITDKDSETLSQYLKRIKPGSGSVVCELHFNAGATLATGVETLVKDLSSKSLDLAREINQVIVNAAGLYNRGVKTEADSKRGKLAILNTSAGIAVLPEICFITNKDDMHRYNRYKKDIAIRIAALLKKYDDMYQ